LSHSTRNLNKEPIALMGLTQSEVIVMIVLSVGSMVPTAVLSALLFGGDFKLLVFVIVAGVGTGLVGWGLTLYIQKTKADTPSGFLFQKLRVTLFPSKWKPPLGDFHYRRTRKRL
jgi:conjugative transfer region protein (TIGR03750 family)